jgi:hypothetical protein
LRRLKHVQFNLGLYCNGADFLDISGFLNLMMGLEAADQL